MSTSPSTIDRILSLVGSPTGLTARKMFGEYGLFLDGKMVALVCDDTLFVKPTEPGIDLLGEHEMGSPYPGAKPCLMVPERLQNQPGRLEALFEATAQALPAPKPKKAKTSITEKRNRGTRP
ncbi:MAG: TfoX/Sxy family protein [Fibrobacteria bacterium]|nr:TfoX/Sxy family protein [Fibrobacteria bacterium]